VKCDKHPEMDAVGTCVYCGRGVCDDCKVRMYDKIHCKECVEAGRIRGNEPLQTIPVFINMGPPPIRIPPNPKGPPKAFLLRMGAPGALLCLLYPLILFSGLISSSILSTTFTMAIYCLGLWILAIGSFGIYWNFGCPWGIFGMVSLPTMGGIILLNINGGMMNLFVLQIPSMVLIHLSLSHMRHHIPNFHISYKIIKYNRILNYLCLCLIPLFVFLIFLIYGYVIFVIWVFYGIILTLDFVFLIIVPLPEPATQGPPQVYRLPPLRPLSKY